MIGDNSGFDAFISVNCWAAITTLRKSGAPSTSLVGYARQGDDLIVSTPGRTFKRKSLERDPRVALCCLSPKAPFSFVTVEGRASVEKTDLAATTRLVFEAIAAFGYKEPADFQKWLDTQDRVIIRVRPERVYGAVR